MGFQTKEFEGYVGSPGERNLIDTILEKPSKNASSAGIVLRNFWNESGS